MGDADEILKLYIRLPINIQEELQIKNLHPDITKVYLPRQKSRRWCIIEFPNNETLEAAKAQLKIKKINGKKLVIGPFNKGGKKKITQQTKRVKKVNAFKADSMLDLLKKEEKKD